MGFWTRWPMTRLSEVRATCGVSPARPITMGRAGASGHSTLQFFSLPVSAPDRPLHTKIKPSGLCHSNNRRTCFRALMSRCDTLHNLRFTRTNFTHFTRNMRMLNGCACESKEGFCVGKTRALRKARVMKIDNFRRTDSWLMKWRIQKRKRKRCAVAKVSEVKTQ